MTVKLDTVVHHVCEKTGDIHIPDVSAVYAQILAANAGKYPNVLLMPELNGHEDWAEELAWITDNFDGPTGIPIMLDVFGGGSGETPTPQLSTEQITAAMAVANVKWLRFAEVISWYMEHPTLPFPTEYVSGILAFCRTNNLKLFWCEWKVDWKTVPPEEGYTFKAIQSYIEGFEDIVTVAFKTNSGDLEPAAGFAYVKPMFTHWGGTVESWYWETRHRGTEYPPALNDPDNMPVSWMVRHSAEAKDAGAEVIQYEPYWYFFSKTTGIANGNLKTMHYYLNSAMMQMETNVVILQTLKAEWLNNSAKDDVQWLEGRIETGWELQPSAFDFSKMTKKNALSCYTVGGQSPSPNLWLKTDVVAVEVAVKVLGTTLEKAMMTREMMKAEVERILYMYSNVAPLWDPTPGPTGVYRRRRIPGIRETVMTQMPAQTEDAKYVRASVYVRCKIFPKKIWVS